MNGIRIACTLLLIGIFTLNLSAQERPKEVSIRISPKSDSEVLIDTTFLVYGEVEVDSLLSQLGIDEGLEEQPLLKVIVIRDPEREADVARSRPEPVPGPKPMLGVYLDTDHHESDGVRVTGVFGAAAAAGVEENDIIIEIDGSEIQSVEDIGEAKESRQVGDVMRVTVKRDGEARTIAITMTGEQAKSVSRMEEEPHQKGFLGVYTEEIDDELADRLGLESQLGVYLKEVVPGSGADVAGLKSGDVITHIEGRELDAAWELGEALAEFSPGEKVLVGYLRGLQPAIASVELTEKIEHNPKPTRWKQVKVEDPYLGVHLDNEGRGVLITRIIEGEGAEAAGLQVGDRIVSFDRTDVETFEGLVELIRQHMPGDEVRLEILRGEDIQRVSATLGSRYRHEWVTLPPEADMDPEELLEQMEDKDQASELQQQMEEPSLDMEEFEFFPNPNTGQFRLRFTLPDMGDTDVRVFSPEGKEVYRERLRNFSGSYDKRINLGDNLARGIYFLQVTRNGKGMVERLIIR